MGALCTICQQELRDEDCAHRKVHESYGACYEVLEEQLILARKREREILTRMAEIADLMGRD